MSPRVLADRAADVHDKEHIRLDALNRACLSLLRRRIGLTVMLVFPYRIEVSRHETN